MKAKCLILLCILVVTSCASKKDIFYIQDAYENNKAEIAYQTITIQPNDILKINVETLIPEASRPYNMGGQSVGNQMASLQILQISGYLVSNEGVISFPVLGEVEVKGLTVTEAGLKIKEELIDGGHLKDPKVMVRIVNAKVTVLGEVENPGTFSFTEQNISLFQALGLAGDLTINGKRDDIIITREVDGSREITHVDITNTEFMNSEYYYLKPNDIIIVNPNKPRVTSSGYIPSLPALLSVTTVILSSIILITNTN